MRIARALALAGIDSRRKCEVFVKNGAVAVNGEIVRDLGRQVNPEEDVILFRGRPLAFEKYVYFILHKPAGYTTTAADPHAEKTVYDLLPRSLAARNRQSGAVPRTRVFPVGRLDRDSSGLLLFTNDGGLANHLTHPRYGVGKWYDVKLNRPLEFADGKKILTGVKLKEGMAHAEKIERISRRALRVLIREGKKREIRRMFERLNYRVLELCRVAFGPIVLGSMPEGHGRFLKPQEAALLRNVVPART